MKYERLTSRDWAKNKYAVPSYKRLAELEDKIEQGALIELPCKVGDTVYFETYMVGRKVEIRGHKVVGFKICALVKRNSEIMAAEIPIAKFDKSVFLSKEEAEAKLKELKGE